MKRQWKQIPAEDLNVRRFINTLVTEFSVALHCQGDHTWNGGNAAGFGPHASTDDYSGPLPERLQQLADAFPNEWIFGHFGYNLKSETEQVTCAFPNEDGFADLYFFVPEIVIRYDDGVVKIGAFGIETVNDLLRRLENDLTLSPVENGVVLEATTTAGEYRSAAQALLKHIHRGDIYEVNYCIDFTGRSHAVNAPAVFENLHALSEAPFSALYKNQQAWLMCASPERFLSKQNSRLISQPIKGTRRRSNNAVMDEQLKRELLNDQKERSENVMIVDLVRNDLSRVAKRGSVRVSELFGIHTFKTVHQMISTVECELRDDAKLSDIIRATFPMGSMTGAPKISAMKLAEKYEKQSRGIYSGSVGYITPDGGFDFNVVIRSITWNSQSGHISAKAGSALTAKAEPDTEYAECLLKAQAMMQALNPARVKG